MAYKVYVATEDLGVYYSSDFELDGGQPTWTAVNDGLPTTDVLQFDVAHMHPYRLTKQFLILEGTRTIYRRLGFGLWSPILTVAEARARVGVPDGSLHWVATDTVIPGVVYALFYYGIIFTGAGIYVLKSTDWGDSWSVLPVVTLVDYGYIHDVGNMMARNGHVWVGGNAGGYAGAGRVFYSANGGESFANTTTLGSSDWSPSVYSPADEPNVCYAYDRSGITYGFIKVLDSMAWSYVRSAGLGDAPLGSDRLWINPNTYLRQRQRFSNSLYYTHDGWASETISTVNYSSVRGLYTVPQNNTHIVVGRISSSTDPSIAVMPETGLSLLGRAGSGYSASPYTDSIPKPTVSGGVSNWGIQIVSGWQDQETASCYVATSSLESVARRYYGRLRDQNGNVVAIFDNWLALEYGRTIDDVDYAVMQLDGNDTRRDLFELDGQFEIMCSVPGCDVGWYRDFIGLFRMPERETLPNNSKYFVAHFVGLNDLLARTAIAYKGGTIRAEKSDVAETVMKEYVEENCGPGATVANGREYDGVLPYFIVDTDGGEGVLWRGTREFANLLDVLKDISNTRGIDFAVEYTGYPEFTFKTYVDQLGSDRTKTGLDRSTGLNAYGNVPVSFSIPLGNVQKMKYTKDRRAEINVVYVLGKGERSTRQIVVRTNLDAMVDSPWNRRESSRSGSSQDYTYQLNQLGDEMLEQCQAVEKLEFEPLQQPSCLYGKHYFLGDRVVAIYDDISMVKRLTGVKVGMASNRHTISLTFSDVPRLV